jgi:hypothetical protein
VLGAMLAICTSRGLVGVMGFNVGVYLKDS